MWTLEEAIPFARTLQKDLRGTGWYVGIGGGVLHKGSSSHDLDLVFIPHYGATLKSLGEGLSFVGWRLVRSHLEMMKRWREKGLLDTKHVEEWADPQGRRVDVIVMRVLDEDGPL